MKKGPLSTHVQSICNRINYTTQLKLDDPWKMLGIAVLLQGALDFINWHPKKVTEVGCLKAGFDFLSTYEFYADLIGLEIRADEFLMLVFEQHRNQKHATAFIDCYLKGE